MSKPRLSFEFFPPKTDAGREKLARNRAELNALKPDFFSVTYGAGGSTRDYTVRAVLDIQAEGLAVAPHLSFGSDSREQVLGLLDRYREAGIRRVVALRGDIPSGHGGQRPVYARELVALIREHSGDHFHIEVAAYPEIHPDAPGYDADIDFLKGKIDAGADSAITQYFFNADAYFCFVERCRARGIEAPIYPGIMPITNFANLARFSRNCGAEIPRWLARRLEELESDETALREFGEETVVRLCQQLLAGGAPGLHFYTMNQSQPSTRIVTQLGIF